MSTRPNKTVRECRRCRKHRQAPGVEPVTVGPLGAFNLIGVRPDPYPHISYHRLDCWLIWR